MKEEIYANCLYLLSSMTTGGPTSGPTSGVHGRVGQCLCFLDSTSLEVYILNTLFGYALSPFKFFSLYSRRAW